jgi:transposase
MALLSFVESAPRAYRLKVGNADLFRNSTEPGTSPGSEDTKLGVLWSRRCVMERRKFTREFKLEAVKLVKDRGVSYARAAEDLGVHPTQLRNWVKALADDPQHSFPGQGQMKPEQSEIARLKREVAKLKAERDILKNCHGPLPACAR